ncbi:hypothetical protein [Teredinibacter purpureus]|uniref:hypothetical protein n=1 Tax=Teredinibacter purpureus TaxID=2731756 RepID=UPI0005F8650F|nr:hypothetical protein [Teredinibacter purpureus]
MLGESYNYTLDQIYEGMPPTLREKLYEDNKSQLINLTPREIKRVVAEEWVAGIAETNPKNTWVEKIAAVIKGWLREVKPDLLFSQNEIVALLDKGSSLLHEKSDLQHKKMIRTERPGEYNPGKLNMKASDRLPTLHETYDSWLAESDRKQESQKPTVRMK